MSNKTLFPEGNVLLFCNINSTMHAALEIEGQQIYLADSSSKTDKSSTVEIVLNLESKEQIDNIFEKAKEEKCKIKMELEKTFWGAYYARFDDKFGVGWQLNYSIEELEK